MKIHMKSPQNDPLSDGKYEFATLKGWGKEYWKGSKSIEIAQIPVVGNVEFQLNYYYILHPFRPFQDNVIVETQRFKSKIPATKLDKLWNHKGYFREKKGSYFGIPTWLHSWVGQDVNVPQCRPSFHSAGLRKFVQSKFLAGFVMVLRWSIGGPSFFWGE